MSSSVLVSNLSPDHVKLYTDPDKIASFRDGVNAATALSGQMVADPGPSAEALNLGFTQAGGWKAPKLAPSDPKQLYRWVFDSLGGSAFVTPLGGKRESAVEIKIPGRAELSTDDILYLQGGGHLIVDPVAAALAVYKLDPNRDKDQIQAAAFDEKASAKIIENLTSAGRRHAKFLSIQAPPLLKNFLAIAAAMDTASRDPQKMSLELIEAMIKFYGTGFSETTTWIGTGTEHLDAEKRNDPNFLANKGNWAELIEARRKQIMRVHDYGRTPILFPDILQSALSEANNISLTKQLLSILPNQIVGHKLGSPFNPKTDWLSLSVLSEIAELAFAVKSSDPRYPNQMADYRAIRKGAEESGKPIVMYTGDDRGWAFDWHVGAQIQAMNVNSGHESNTYERNGNTFVKDRNISALLGFIGLNPYQTIVAIVKLSRWFNEVTQDKPDPKVVSSLLDSYWDIMAPSLLLGTDSFFGENDPTPAYTHKVMMTNRFTGVLDENDGTVLPHRDSHWAKIGDKENLQVINSRLYCLLIIAGAITPGEATESIKANEDSLRVA